MKLHELGDIRDVSKSFLDRCDVVLDVAGS
jgi:hypothetical protein